MRIATWTSCSILSLTSAALAQSWFTANSTPVPKVLAGGVAIDLDGDGRDELVAATQSVPGGPFVLTAYTLDSEGLAIEGFSSSTLAGGAAIGSSRVESGDITGDGMPDVVVPTSAGITVVRGVLGGFGTSYLASSQALAPALGDVDNDGDLDFATLATVGAGAAIALNDGSGTFGAPIFSASGINAGSSAIACGDVDADGRLDVVLRVAPPFSSAAIGVMRGTSSPGAFSPAFGSPFLVYLGAGYYDGIAVADFDADGDADVIAPGAYQLALLRSTTTSFAPAITIADGGRNMIVADLDGDSTLDVVTGNIDASIVAVLDPGAMPATRKLSTPRIGSWPIVGRFTSPTARDIAMVDTMSSFLDAPRGTITCAPHEPSAGSPLQPSVGKLSLPGSGFIRVTREVDFDGDGDPDIVVATLSAGVSLVVLSGDGDLGFQGNFPVATTLSDDLEVGDLDVDGDLDVAIGAGAELAWVHRQVGSGILGPGVPVALSGGDVTRIEIGDLDLDGKPDLFGGVAAGGSSAIRIAKGSNPTTLTFVETAPFAVGGPLGEFHAADLDLDSDSDLLASRYAAGAWQLVTATSSGGGFAPWSRFASITTGTIAAGPLVDDFDGDGRNDVVVRVRDQLSAARVLFGKGVVGGFSPLVEFAVEPDGVGLDAGDIDLDGRVDILVENADHGIQEVWEQGPIGSFAITALHPGIASLAHLDGDERLDRFTKIEGRPELILMRNESAGSVQSFGSPCALGGVSPPTLDATNPALAGSSFSLSLSQGFGGATAILLFGQKAAVVPVGLGCSFHLTPVLPTILSFVLPGSGAGQGSLAIPTVLPPALAGITFSTQAATIEGPSVFTLSNALVISVK